MKSDLPEASAGPPWYPPVADEVALFEAAFQARMPVLLKGPTGCGKTCFVEHMAWRLSRLAPLITVSCHEDRSASDLIGRYLVIDEVAAWPEQLAKVYRRLVSRR